MSKAKYHVGDRVLIVPESTKGMPSSMAMYCNHIMTIKTVLRGFNQRIYHMFEDFGMWYWRDEDIIGRVVKKEQYEVGDVVLVPRGMKVSGDHESEARIVKSITPTWLPGSAWYTCEGVDGGLCGAWLHHDIEGCLEQPEESIPKGDIASDLNRGWNEVVTIKSDGTHTEASLTRTGSNPVSLSVSLRRDSRDTHDLYAAAKLALDKLRDKDRQKELPPLYTGDVFCVDSCGMADRYTTGKIYPIKNGVLTNDRGGAISGIRDFKWLEVTAAKWMEVVK